MRSGGALDGAYLLAEVMNPSQALAHRKPQVGPSALGGCAVRIADVPGIRRILGVGIGLHLSANRTAAG
jgi:hypothetical protein